MTKLTVDRATIEQALEALETSGCSAFKGLACRCSRECASYIAAKALRAALAQEQAGCETEADCTSQPWCRISGECHKRRNDPCACSRNAMLCDGLGPPQEQAEPVQEPMAWASDSIAEWAPRQTEKVVKLTREAHPEFGYTVSLYTTPPQRPPLTEKQIESAVCAEYVEKVVTRYDITIARAIERAHGIGA